MGTPDTDMLFLAPPTLLVTRMRRAVPSKNALARFCASVAPANNSRPRSETRNRNFAKKKVALMIGYDGAKYHGLQRNPDVETVSDALERALHAAGAISDDNLGFLEKIKWQVAARTDRGVSAAGNLVSAKLLFQREEQDQGDAFEKTVCRVNAELPDDVRIFEMKYVTNSFSAKGSCGERWYEYMLPLSALRGDKSLEDFRDTLNIYEGSHRFHNYTVGLDHTLPPRPQAMRYVTKASCDLEPVHLQGSALADSAHAAWVRIHVRGQSFMLHQIRKMVSLAVLTHNSDVVENAIERSFDPDVLINVPPAPAVGLFLDCCHFKWYNERHKAALPEPLSFSNCDSAREMFKHGQIFPSIARRAVEEDALEIYFRTVNKHPVEFS